MVYETNTKLNCEEINEKALNFFGYSLGLETTDKNENCLNFEGGGGFVNIICCTDEDNNRVELTTREWDRKVKSFMKKI
ncbi:MAG: hypothetical protein ACOCQS_01560 [Bacillota bacterium]